MALKYKSVFDEIRGNPNYSYLNSQRWFRNKVKELALRPNDPRLLQDKRATNAIEPGFLYMFAYDAKHKDTLPYWDAFPMTFIFGFTKTGFIGINFHYLPIAARFALFDRLALNHLSNSKFDLSTKVNADWGTLKNFARFPQVKPAVKQYLISNVRSRFIKIPINDWKPALLLPVENFQGASKTTVWNNSSTIIRN
ncbi:hypothetical protein [Synechococcus phage BUCT-ZZ01]|nr:hypothetical protein [Synechococcus phage BUCT-ZZ01]